ncbi:MAG: host attachment protein [Candidatus Sedimenticola endophacoides]
MSSAWVVVADTSRARIFSAERPASSLIEIETLSHPEGRLHKGELVTDRPGRGRTNGARSHDTGGQGDAKEEETSRFASEICHALEAGRLKGRYKKLYVIAAPGFLGALRKHRKSALQQLIAEEIPKNLATHDIDEIRQSLPRYL